ncbi:precorrin-2 C(20)-methyltransferase [Oscillatoria sp. FACHB-1406]|uniref:precorrin-2 C(20)-methyltransferase n=1 Tax=Oscillatoria sp. FACHB-1406 TaxID=2692846 RepID=UPI0016854B52|nr:precorrin-2 C(20)-methyltransferase [Oscillatoria sp. FACHB-1406]
MQIGTLYGISVGPGDPELITLKGLRLLRTASAIAFPAGIKGKPGKAERIIAPWSISEQKMLPLNFPYVPDFDVLTRAWHEAAEQVWQYLERGEDVAFACEGDISFYGTFAYLAQTLQQLHPEVVIEIVPGVSSPLAAAATLGLPLTARDQRLAVLPAIYTIGELKSVLQWADVLVLMKVSSVYEQVWQILQEYRLLDRAVAVENVTLPEQKIYTDLCDRPTLKLSYFSLIVVQVRDPVLANTEISDGRP